MRHETSAEAAAAGLPGAPFLQGVKHARMPPSSSRRQLGLAVLLVLLPVATAFQYSIVTEKLRVIDASSNSITIGAAVQCPPVCHEFCRVEARTDGGWSRMVQWQAHRNYTFKDLKPGNRYDLQALVWPQMAEGQNMTISTHTCSEVTVIAKPIEVGMTSFTVHWHTVGVPCASVKYFIRMWPMENHPFGLCPHYNEQQNYTCIQKGAEGKRYEDCSNHFSTGIEAGKRYIIQLGTVDREGDCGQTEMMIVHTKRAWMKRAALWAILAVAVLLLSGAILYIILLRKRLTLRNFTNCSFAFRRPSNARREGQDDDGDGNLVSGTEAHPLDYPQERLTS